MDNTGIKALILAIDASDVNLPAWLCRMFYRISFFHHLKPQNVKRQNLCLWEFVNKYWCERKKKEWSKSCMTLCQLHVSCGINLWIFSRIANRLHQICSMIFNTMKLFFSVLCPSVEYYIQEHVFFELSNFQPQGSVRTEYAPDTCGWQKLQCTDKRCITLHI